jgi:hypothetical protein
MPLNLHLLKKPPNKGYGIGISRPPLDGEISPLLDDLMRIDSELHLSMHGSGLESKLTESEPMRYNFAPLTDSQLPAMGFAIIFK